MKKLILSIFVLGTLLVFLGSCKDDEKVDGGSFTVDGEKHSLKHAYSIYGGEEEEGEDIYYNWAVVMTSSGLEYGEDGFTGTGDFLYIDIYALNLETTELPTGTFVYPFEEGEHFLIDGGIVLNLDAEEQDGDEVDLGDVETITAVISKSGNRYSIKITVIRTGEANITASYSGAVELLED